MITSAVEFRAVKIVGSSQRSITANLLTLHNINWEVCHWSGLHGWMARFMCGPLWCCVFMCVSTAEGIHWWTGHGSVQMIPFYGVAQIPANKHLSETDVAPNSALQENKESMKKQISFIIRFSPRTRLMTYKCFWFDGGYIYTHLQKLKSDRAFYISI